MRFDLSIRTKITILILMALLISGSALVILGSNLIIRDKTSYIFDYTASQADSVAKNLNLLLEPVSRFAVRAEEGGNQDIATQLLALKNLFGIESRELKRTSPEPQYIDLIRSSDQSGVDVVLHLSDGRVFSFTSNRLQLNEEQLAQDFNLCVTSPTKKRVLFGIERETFKKDGSCNLIAATVNPGFEQGTQEITINQRSYLLGYRGILGGNILVLSLVSKDVAFQSARSLIERSIVLGLALLFFALGITLILLKAITRRIDDLTLASREISKGNLDITLDETQASRDEISVLSNTFLDMSRKIKMLISETATKARMEKELEAAEFVQKQFFPSGSFQDQRIKIKGVSKSASECGGDLWQFRKIGSRIYFVFGDVTGHGVPAALITASVFGAFTALMESVESHSIHLSSTEESLQHLGSTLNSAVTKSAKGATWFSCMIGIIDLDSGVMSYQNYSHPRPFFWEGASAEPESLKSAPSHPMGTEDVEIATIFTKPFPSGSRLVLYSDGLFDHRPTDQKALNKKEILPLIDSWVKSGIAPEQILENLMEQAREFFGSTPPDDVTLVLLEANQGP